MIGRYIIITLHLNCCFFMFFSSSAVVSLVGCRVSFSAALKYYPTVLLATATMGFALLNTNILLADRSTNTAQYLCKKFTV